MICSVADVIECDWSESSIVELGIDCWTAGKPIISHTEKHHTGTEIIFWTEYSFFSQSAWLRTFPGISRQMVVKVWERKWVKTRSHVNR